jgi:hypothetical protein
MEELAVNRRYFDSFGPLALGKHRECGLTPVSASSRSRARIAGPGRFSPQALRCLPPAEINLVESVPASATREAGPLTTGTVKDDWRELPIPTGRPTSIRISAK